MKTLLASVLSLAAVLASAVGAEKKAAADPAKIGEMTRLQVLLDRANFGPGKIDGRGGEFTKKALERYRLAQGGAPAQGAAPAADQLPAEGAEGGQPKEKSRGKKAGEAKSGKAEEQLDLSGLDLQSVGEPFVTYTVTAADLENVGELPKEPAAQAKLKALPYETGLEAIAEKFHSDVDFIKELNPKVDLAKLKEGDALTVPNVEPFDLAAVKQIKPGEDLVTVEASESTPEGAGEGAKSENADTRKESGNAKESSETKKENAKTDEAARNVTVFVDTKDKMLEVRDGEKLLAAFPVTPGSGSIPTPIGNWKIKGVAKMPDYRYDEKMLKEGERGEEAHLLPPGPNSPVGVMWIALNKKGIGLHGTNDPDTIGRAASHGCVRLANWDVAKLARMVKSGVSVTIE